MTKRRWFLAGTLGIAVLVALSIGLVKWRAYVIRAQDQRNYQIATQLVEGGDYPEALTAIRLGRQAAQASALSLDRWLQLKLDALRKSRDVPRLLLLYEKLPNLIRQNEEASLLVARAQLSGGDPQAFQQLRKFWLDRTTAPQAWFALDVDALFLDGKAEEATKLLRSRSFAGPADCGRLARLALLEAESDLPRAWELLRQAYQLDSKNPDIRSFRAQILERVGRYREARIEYVAAYLAEPTNPLLCNQLAEFYRRRGNYALALETWAGRLKRPSLDMIWLKVAFWSRVTRPIDATMPVNDMPVDDIPNGDLQPLVRYVLALPDSKYWDADKFALIPEGSRYRLVRQETFWLRLLQLLKTGKESEALNLLKKNRFRQQSWNPALEDGLAWVLAYRSGTGTIPEWVMARVDTMAPDGRRQHQFFDALTRWCKRCRQEAKACKPNPELEPLLASDEVFAATLLAGGWNEAAIRLNRAEVLPKDFPDWVAYGLTQALRFNRGNRQALDFAKRQAKHPAMKLLVGELLLTEGRSKQGLKCLAELAAEDSPVGFRAAWLSGVALVESGELEKAKHVVQANRQLAQSITGKEMFARIALLEGKKDEADRFYGELGDKSIEAMTYLARTAFAKKDWNEARRLTLELLDRIPDELQLRANLEAIAKAERSK